MQYLAVTFLKWVVTSCVMWGIPTCLSMPLYAASFPQVALPEAVVQRALQAHRDHRVLQAHRALQDHRDHRDQAAQAAQAARSARSARVARVAAVDPPVQVPEADLDPVEVLVPSVQAVAPGPADFPAPLAIRGALDQAQVARRATPVRVAFQARRVRVDRLVAQVRPAHPAHRVRLPPVAARPVVLAASVPAVLAAQAHRAARAVLVVAQRAVVAPARRAVAVVRAITNGQYLAGCRSLSQIRALLRRDRFKSTACAPETNQPVLVPTSAKPFTPSVRKFCCE
jgi:hypothetical protein